MSSTGLKQSHTDAGYYIPVGSLLGKVYARTEPTGNTGVLGGTFSTASWAYFGPSALSSINGAGAGILKDMGRTVVSSLRTFRKVQLVVNNSQRNGTNFALSTNGVAGQNTYQAAGNTGSAVQDFLTGYIELGFEGTGPSAPVVPYGR